MKDLTLENLFGDEEVEVDCPSCNKTFQVEFKKVLTPNSSVECANCGQEIVINHDETAEKSLKDADKSLNEFNKSFDKLEKAFKKFR